MSVLEIIGFVTGVAGVWLAARENPWTWPVGIINVTIYVFVFLKSGLYGDMGLQVFYILIGFYGWYTWLHGNENSKLQIANCKLQILAALLLISAILFFFLSFLLQKTDSTVPYLDALTTVLSISATWMMTRKYIEHWMVWIFVDLVYVGLYIYKLLYLTAGLYLIFTILAVYGYIEWKKIMKVQST